MEINVNGPAAKYAAGIATLATMAVWSLAAYIAAQVPYNYIVAPAVLVLLAPLTYLFISQEQKQKYRQQVIGVIGILSGGYIVVATVFAGDTMGHLALSIFGLILAAASVVWKEKKAESEPEYNEFSFRLGQG